jgi:UDP-N-acetylmuramate--alanine ligase
VTRAGDVIRGAGAIGRGLAAAREARPIRPGEVIHVVGAAGAGASAAALLASAAGATVSGCDPGAPSAYTAALEHRAIPVATVHDAAHVSGTAGKVPARLAVTKALTSVQPDHPELEAARRSGIPVEPWQQVVADAAVSQGGRLVAIAGTHGKSTSAGWLVHLLVACGRDPAAFVGALLPSALTDGPPATARWGRGDTFVVEADEYAGNFDPYRPALAVVLNAEWDHPDVFADRAAVVDAFETWLCAPGAQVRQVVIDTDDAGGAELAGRLAGWGDRVVPVTAQTGHGGRVEDVRETGVGRRAVGHHLEGRRLRITGLPGLGGATVEAELRLPGAHNAANAACVAATAALLGVSATDIASGLASFSGVGRRFEVKAEPAGVLVIDDYGHHPTAIRATIEAVRTRYPGRPVWVAHEPLTFHRAAAMLEELAAALASADHVVIADIWAGRDPDTTIASAVTLAAAVAQRRGEDVAAPGSVEATADYLAARVQSGDVVLAMGGGRSWVIAERLVSLLAARADG